LTTGGRVLDEPSLLVCQIQKFSLSNQMIDYKSEKNWYRSCLFEGEVKSDLKISNKYRHFILKGIQ
jgi:hypothetical protein